MDNTFIHGLWPLKNKSLPEWPNTTCPGNAPRRVYMVVYHYPYCRNRLASTDHDVFIGIYGLAVRWSEDQREIRLIKVVHGNSVSVAIDDSDETMVNGWVTVAYSWGERTRIYWKRTRSHFKRECVNLMDLHNKMCVSHIIGFSKYVCSRSDPHSVSCLHHAIKFTLSRGEHDVAVYAHNKTFVRK